MACNSMEEESSGEKTMNKTSWLELITGIILIVMFLVSWLVFKNIKPFDWVILLLGVLDLISVVAFHKKDN